MAWTKFTNQQQKTPAFYISKGSIIINNAAIKNLKLSSEIKRVTLRYDDEKPNLVRMDFHKSWPVDSLPLIKVAFPYDKTKCNLRINCSKFFELIGFKHPTCKYKCTNFKRENDYVVLDLNDRFVAYELD